MHSFSSGTTGGAHSTALGAHGLPVIEADLVPGEEARAFRARPVVAFAGIGRPEKFFETLEESGCTVIARHAFADHHRYKPVVIARPSSTRPRNGAPSR